MKPMLAATMKSTKELMLPMLASPKYDGVRATIHDGVVMSRNFKPIPNKHVQNLFGDRRLNGLDGELIVGEPTAPDCYRNTMSGVMSADGLPFVSLYAFDWVGPNEYHVREQIAERLALLRPTCIWFVKQSVIRLLYELDAYEEECLALGYEGVMLRSIDGRYKHGRSTMNEGYLVKVKRFCDTEAMIIGYEERMHNGNEATVDELGRTKRSSHKANKSGRGDLGALICRTSAGVVFNIGTGFDDATRAELWARRESLEGRFVKYKYFPSGSKDAPRFPVFIGLRSAEDV